MQIDEIRQILSNQLNTLEINKLAAFQSGDLMLYNKISIEIDETKSTLDKLQTI